MCHCESSTDTQRRGVGEESRSFDVCERDMSIMMEVWIYDRTLCRHGDFLCLQSYIFFVTLLRNHSRPLYPPELVPLDV